MLNVYRQYPFPVSLRTKFFNIFRYFFSYPFFERFLVSRLSKNTNIWPKLIPPLYFYNDTSIRYVERFGINYKLNINRLIDHSIYFYTINEESWKNLFKIIKPKFSIIDVGANIGYLSLNFSKICPEGTVYSFEPDSETFSYLTENVYLNQAHNVKLFNNAVGCDFRTVKLYKLYHNNPGANRILSHEPESNVLSETIQIVTLDSMKLNGQLNKVDLVKIDVEGYELFVLKGATEMIESWRPILFVELAEVNLQQQHCSSLMLIEYIESLNYKVMDARTMVPIDRTFHNHHTDVLCFPNEVYHP